MNRAVPHGPVLDSDCRVSRAPPAVLVAPVASAGLATLPPRPVLAVGRADAVRLVAPGPCEGCGGSPPQQPNTGPVSCVTPRRAVVGTRVARRCGAVLPRRVRFVGGEPVRPCWVDEVAAAEPGLVLALEPSVGTAASVAPAAVRVAVLVTDVDAVVVAVDVAVTITGDVEPAGLAVLLRAPVVEPVVEPAVGPAVGPAGHAALARPFAAISA